MQDEELGPVALCNRKRASLVVAELNEDSLSIEGFHHRAHLAPRQTLLGTRPQKCDNVGEYRCWRFDIGCVHHNTQQVTKRGAASPRRTIHMVLTTTFSPRRSIGTSTRHRV